MWLFACLLPVVVPRTLATVLNQQLADHLLRGEVVVPRKSVAERMTEHFKCVIARTCVVALSSYYLHCKVSLI